MDFFNIPTRFTQKKRKENEELLYFSSFNFVEFLPPPKTAFLKHPPRAFLAELSFLCRQILIHRVSENWAGDRCVAINASNTSRCIEKTGIFAVEQGRECSTTDSFTRSISIEGVVGNLHPVGERMLNKLAG